MFFTQINDTAIDEEFLTAHLKKGACGLANFVLVRLQLVIMRRLLPHFVKSPMDEITAGRISRLWHNHIVVIGREHYNTHDRYKGHMEGFDFGLTVAFGWLRTIKKNMFCNPVPGGKMPRSLQKTTDSHISPEDSLCMYTPLCFFI